MKKKHIVILLLPLIIINIIAFIRNKDENKSVNQVIISQWALINDGLFCEYSAYSTSWNMDEVKSTKNIDIQARNIEDIFSNKRNVIIAVIDSDIYYNHKALRDKIWVNNAEVPNDYIDNDKNGYIDDVYGWNFFDNDNILYNNKECVSPHGTHMAGIMCGDDDQVKYTSLLTASNEKIMCLKALGGENANGSLENVKKAIQYAEENGANICCLSLSTYIYNQELEDIMRKSDMLFVVASGNQGIEITNDNCVYPCAFQLENLISVADIRCDGNLSYNSNYSKSYVDVVAPGTDIVSTFPNNKYGYLSGTSCSAAYVAAEAALIYQQSSKKLKANEIKNIISNNVTILKSLKNKVKSNGIINIYSALKNTN
jgi:subtilisin family serine protease